MDCCICSPMAAVYRLPRNTICSRCYEGGTHLINFFKEIDDQGCCNKRNGSNNGSDQGAMITATAQQLRGFRPSSSMGLSDAFDRAKELRENEERLSERLEFLADGLMAAFRDGVYTDLLVQAGSGLPIPAHRALLATKSPIFQTMLSSDECKAPPVNGTIHLPELTYDQLQSLLAFLYTGAPNILHRVHSEDDRDVDEHELYFSLLLVADKYDIPFLKTTCEARILGSVGPSNALQVLEVADTCSSAKLKEEAMRLIVKHMEDVVLSAAYDTFALKNAHLCVEITRALLTEVRAKRAERII